MSQDEKAPVTDEALSAALGSLPPSPQAGGKKIRFKVGAKSSAPGAGAEHEPHETPTAESAAAACAGPAGEAGAAAEGVAPPAAPAPPGRAAIIGKRVYRALDGLLDVMNQPLTRLPGWARSAIGVVGATTLVVCLLSAALIPILRPNRDAVGFVREKRAALDRPRPATVPAAAHASEAPPGGGH